MRHKLLIWALISSSDALFGTHRQFEIVLRFPIVICLCFFASCGEDEKSSLGKLSTKMEIENFVKEYRNAWMQGDSSAVMQKISDSIVFFNHTENGKPIVGKNALREYWYPDTDISYPVLDFQVRQSDIIVSDNIAVYRGLSELLWYTLDKKMARDTTISISEFTEILIKEEEDWKLYSIMFVLKDSTYESGIFK